MRKIRLVVIVFFMVVAFSSCNTSESLDQLIEDTEIENTQNTDDDEEEPDTGTSSLG